MSDLGWRNWAFGRINSMRSTPAMWAFTEEGFVLQIAVVLEVAGLTQRQVHQWLSTVNPVLDDRLTNERAEMFTAKALEVFPD